MRKFNVFEPIFGELFEYENAISRIRTTLRCVNASGGTDCPSCYFNQFCKNDYDATFLNPPCYGRSGREVNNPIYVEVKPMTFAEILPGLKEGRRYMLAHDDSAYYVFDKKHGRVERRGIDGTYPTGLFHFTEQMWFAPVWFEYQVEGVMGV